MSDWIDTTLYDLARGTCLVAFIVCCLCASVLMVAGAVWAIKVLLL